MGVLETVLVTLLVTIQLQATVGEWSDYHTWHVSRDSTRDIHVTLWQLESLGGCDNPTGNYYFPLLGLNPVTSLWSAVTLSPPLRWAHHAILPRTWVLVEAKTRGEIYGNINKKPGDNTGLIIIRGLYSTNPNWESEWNVRIQLGFGGNFGQWAVVCHKPGLVWSPEKHACNNHTWSVILKQISRGKYVFSHGNVFISL